MLVSQGLRAPNTPEEVCNAQKQMETLPCHCCSAWYGWVTARWKNTFSLYFSPQCIWQSFWEAFVPQELHGGHGAEVSSTQIPCLGHRDGSPPTLLAQEREERTAVLRGELSGLNVGQVSVAKPVLTASILPQSGTGGREKTVWPTLLSKTCKRKPYITFPPSQPLVSPVHIRSILPTLKRPCFNVTHIWVALKRSLAG